MDYVKKEKKKEYKTNSQLHNQVEMVRTLIDVLKCHNVLMLYSAKQRQTISKDFYYKAATDFRPPAITH